MVRSYQTIGVRLRATGLGVITGIVLGVSPNAYAAIVYTGCSSGSSCTMAELFGGGSIQIDDLLFDAFTAGTNIGPVAGNVVTVSATGEGMTDLGLVTSYNGELAAGTLTTLSYTFDLSSLADLTVTGAALSMDTFSGDGATFSMAPAGQSSFEADGNNTSVSSPFPVPWSGLGLLASGSSLTVSAGSASSVDQTTHSFSVERQPAQVPIPIPLALVSLGIALLAAFRLRARG